MVTRMTDFPDNTCCQVTGPAAAPAVVLVHGIGLNLLIWDDFVPVLSEKFRVIRYDLPGHGGSATVGSPLSLTKLSLHLAGLMDHLEIKRAAIAGFSLGGMINRRFAMDYPDRVSALVIMNSPHARDAEAQQLVEQRAFSSDAGPGDTLDDAIQRWFTSGFIARRPEVIDRVRTWVLASDPRSFHQCRQILASGVTELVRPDPPVRRPALVMTCGQDSGSTPSMARSIAGEIPGSETVIVPGLRHLGMLEKPSLFLGPMVTFLDSIESR